jgi:hypothetical protein
MARQGNYVTIPGGGTNWASGISDSLNSLSKSLLSQGDKELERERLAVAEEENRRRFDLGISRDDARNSVLDQRYNAEQAEAARRYMVDQDRLKAQDKIATEARTKALLEEEATRGILKNYSLSDERRRVYESDPVLQKAINDQTKGFRTSGATSLFVDDVLDRAQSEGRGEEFGVSRGLTQNMTPTGETALLYRDYLLGIDDKELNPRALAVKKSIQDQDKQIEDRLNTYVETATPLYKGDAVSSLGRRIIEAGGSLSPEATAGIGLLTSPLGTRKEATAQTLSAQKAAQARLNKLGDLAYKAATLTQKNSNSGDSGYIKPKILTPTEAMDEIEAMDAGWSDAGALSTLYKAAVDKGVNPAIAMQSLKETTDDDFNALGIRTKGPSKGVEDFILYAQAREAANGSGGDKKSFEQYMKQLTPDTAPYTDPVAENYQAFIDAYGLLEPQRRRLPLRQGRVNTPVEENALTPNQEVRGDIPGFDFDPEEGRPFGEGGARARREDTLRNLERAIAAIPAAGGFKASSNILRKLLGNSNAVAPTVRGFSGRSPTEQYWRSLERPAFERTDPEVLRLRQWFRDKAAGGSAR